jgi:hypothetical protein
MPDKRFDSRPEEKGVTTVREHQRRLESGMETTVSQHLRHLGLTLNYVKFFKGTTRIKEVDISPEYESYSLNEGYRLRQEEGGFVTIWQKASGTQMKFGSVPLTGKDFEEAIRELAAYGDSYVPFHDREGW